MYSLDSVSYSETITNRLCDHLHELCFVSRTSERDRDKMQVETPKGSVKWSNSAKGYGPVGRHYGPDIFIQAGDQVEFEIVRGPKAPQAANPISSSELIRACASSNNEIP